MCTVPQAVDARILEADNAVHSCGDCRKPYACAGCGKQPTVHTYRHAFQCEMGLFDALVPAAGAAAEAAAAAAAASDQAPPPLKKQKK